MKWFGSKLLIRRRHLSLTHGGHCSSVVVRATDDRVVTESNPRAVALLQTLGKFVYPTFIICVFLMRHNKLLVPSIWCPTPVILVGDVSGSGNNGFGKWKVPVGYFKYQVRNRKSGCSESVGDCMACVICVSD